MIAITSEQLAAIQRTITGYPAKDAQDPEGKRLTNPTADLMGKVMEHIHAFDDDTTLDEMVEGLKLAKHLIETAIGAWSDPDVRSFLEQRLRETLSDPNLHIGAVAFSRVMDTLLKERQTVFVPDILFLENGDMLFGLHWQLGEPKESLKLSMRLGDEQWTTNIDKAVLTRPEVATSRELTVNVPAEMMSTYHGQAVLELTVAALDKDGQTERLVGKSQITPEEYQRQKRTIVAGNIPRVEVGWER